MWRIKEEKKAKELAKELGTSVWNIYSWEQNKTQIPTCVLLYLIFKYPSFLELLKNEFKIQR